MSHIFQIGVELHQYHFIPAWYWFQDLNFVYLRILSTCPMTVCLKNIHIIIILALYYTSCSPFMAIGYLCGEKSVKFLSGRQDAAGVPWLIHK